MRRIRYVSFALALVGAAAVIATWSRFESFDPCVWMEQEMASESGLPRLVVRGRIKADFLLSGVNEPDGYQCLQAWWRFRAGSPPHHGQRS